MTDIKSAIDFLTRYKGCQYEIDPKECCHRECSECDYNYDIRIAQKKIETAIRSLKAWEEVLNELEEKKDVYILVPISSTAMGKAYTYDDSTICMAIDIINQHLAEIEK